MAAIFGNIFPKVAAMAQSFQRQVGSLIIMLGRSPVVQENLLCREVPSAHCLDGYQQVPVFVCALCVRVPTCVCCHVCGGLMRTQ